MVASVPKTFSAPAFALLLLMAPLCSGVSAARRDGETDIFLWKIYQCLEAKDIGCSKIYLEKVFAKDPNNAVAWRYQAAVYSLEGDEAKSDKALERAYTLDPSLEKEDTEAYEEAAIQGEAKMSQQEFSHFKLGFVGAEERDKAWEAVRYLDDAYSFLTSHYDLYPKEKFQAILFTGQQFQENWFMHWFAAGFYDPKDGIVRLQIPEGPGDAKLFRQVCRHEFTHAFFHRFYKGDLPTWFSEGTAEFYGGMDSSDSLWKEKRLAEISRELKGLPPVTLAQLEYAMEHKKELYAAIQCYRISEAFILWCAKTRGDSWIPNVLRELRAGSRFEVAFQKAIGQTPAASLEQFFREF